MAGGLLGGRYRLDQVLGRGGMAVVWRADDQRLGRFVAVKVLDRAELDDPSALARFEREARTVARLAHPNIVTVHDVGVDDGVPYLVMELVTGRSLADRLVDGPIPVDEAVRIAGQVCAALEAAHAAGVVHRDVKPANILLTPMGAVKVCDFGIAHGPDGAWRRTGTATGTSEYMAPEQLADGAVDHRVDLYALGCVMYAMLTGQPPFSGDSPQRVGWQHLHETATPLAARRAGLPPELTELVDQLLAKNPAARPASAADVLARLPRSSAPRSSAPQALTEPTLTAVAPPDVSIRGSAAVLQRTQMMPALDYADAPRTVPERGIRLSPAWIAALAVGIIALVVVTIVALTQGRPGTQAGPPVSTPSAAATSASTAPSAAPSTPPIGTPAQAIDAIQAALRQQENANQLDKDAANDLSHQLNDIQHRLGHDNSGKSADKVDELRHMLASALDDGNITQAGYDAVSPLVDQLAALMPDRSGDNQG